MGLQLQVVVLESHPWRRVSQAAGNYPCLGHVGHHPLGPQLQPERGCGKVNCHCLLWHYRNTRCLGLGRSGKDYTCRCQRVLQSSPAALDCHQPGPEQSGSVSLAGGVPQWCCQ